MAEEDNPEQEVVQAQFKRNLDNIVIGDGPGPEITVGEHVLRFKKSAPVTALAALLANENRVAGMETYLRKTLLPGQDESLDAVLDSVDITGLSAILEALGEGFTSFPEQS